MANVVSIEDLTIEFPTKAGRLRAVDHVSFSLEAGKITALVGESGSGKSTLASAILNVVSSPGAIIGGRVMYGDQDILTMSDHELQRYRWAKVSMVFQAAQNSLNPVMHIRDTMIETAVSHGEKDSNKTEARLRELLEYVRLDPDRVLASYPHELSGGMKQRVMIAFSLLLSPDLIVLDEPTTALDVITQEYILEILLNVHRDLGTSMLLLSHDMAVVAKTADLIGVMYAGRLIESANVYDLFARPGHPYSRGLIHAAPSLLAKAGQVQVIPGSPPNLLDLPPGCAFHPRCEQAQDHCRVSRPELRQADRGWVACHYPLVDGQERVNR